MGSEMCIRDRSTTGRCAMKRYSIDTAVIWHTSFLGACASLAHISLSSLASSCSGSPHALADALLKTGDAVTVVSLMNRAVDFSEVLLAVMPESVHLRRPMREFSGGLAPEDEAVM